MAQNTLYFGDNLDVLRRHIRDETVTDAPTITIPPTATATPTMTPTPLPTCGSAVANRECPTVGENCFQPCWSVRSIVPPPLECDPGGSHQLSMTATECGDRRGTIIDVNVWFLDDLGMNGPFAMDLQVVDGKRQWVVDACAQGRPSEFTVQWETMSSAWLTKGIGTLEVGYCCAEGSC